MRLRARLAACAAAAAAAAAIGGPLVSAGHAQDDTCIPTSLISDFCVERDTGIGATIDAATDGPAATAGRAAESPYAGAAGCVYAAADTADSLTFQSPRDAYDGACGRNSSGDGFTYYVGSPGSYGVVPYYGASNGHVLRVFENSIRVGQYACVDLWVNGRSGRRYSDTATGLCGLPKDEVFLVGGYNRVGSSWCAGHPGGSSGEYRENIRGRCRYKYDG